MKIDIEELKRLAEAATPGPWEYDYDDQDLDTCNGILWGTNNYAIAILPYDGQVSDEKVTATGNHIAAANPAAILALIEQHEAAHSELLATRDDNHSMMLEIHNLRIERDELLAVLKSIDDAAKTSQSIIGFAGKLMGMLKQARAAIANAEKQS